MKNLPPLALIAALAVAACSAPATTEAAQADTAKLDASGAHPATPLAAAPFPVQEIADFNEPWAMTFIPGPRAALITAKSVGSASGREKVCQSVEISGVAESLKTQ